MNGRRTTILAGSAFFALASICCPAPAAEKAAAPVAEPELQKALSAIREIAMDNTQSDSYRANAVAAHTSLLVAKNRHEEAEKFCVDVLHGPCRDLVAEAAMRAIGFLRWNRMGHLGDVLNSVAQAARGAHGQAVERMRQEMDRVIQTLMSCTGRPGTIPDPVLLSFPNWAVAGPNKAPRALDVRELKMEAPGWHARLQFPPFGTKFEPPGWYARVSFQPLKEGK